MQITLHAIVYLEVIQSNHMYPTIKLTPNQHIIETAELK